MKNKEDWWRGALIYQIYPRSFLDTDADGVGDLPGITARLEYLAALGVDALWISPFFKSPMKDFGYDVSDYRDVDPLFGTLGDFKTLLARAHDHDIKIIIDLVLSHTSDEHLWFRDPAKKDWYVWADPAPGGGPPNNWVSVFGGSAWEWCPTRGQYYLHNFLKEQPDLNFHNPEVRRAALDIAGYWLDMGVDGFRLDVVNFYFHDPALRDNPPRKDNGTFATQFEGDDPYSAQQHIYDKSRPENLEFLKEFRALLDTYPGRFSVGEIGDDDPIARSAEYTGPGLLHTTYNTQMMSGAHKRLTPETIRAPLEVFARQPGDPWPGWAFSNHDVVRAASRWHNGGDGFSTTPRLAKFLVMLLGCLRGTLFLYQSEELGLPEARLSYGDLQDPWGKRLYPAWQGRDGCRTPMPWNDAPNGGFSPAKPWLPVPPEHIILNAAAQENDKHSTLNFSRKFLKWRREQNILRLGDLAFEDTGRQETLRFTRSLDGQTWACEFDFENLGAEIRDESGQILFHAEH